VLPGPNDSSLANDDVGSTVFIGRAKKDMGLSFVGVLATDREARSGDAHNRVGGPDFQWRPSGNDAVSGQLLFSDTKTPDRPDLADEWTGQSLSGHAGTLQWNHQQTHYDAYAMYKDIGDGFRADTGFVPQVGYRELNGSTGWTFRPTNFLTRLRTFVNLDRQADQSGALISRDVQPGFGMDSKWNGFLQFRYIDDQIRALDRVIPRKQVGFTAQFSPSRVFAFLETDGLTGQEIDFANGRPGTGTTINATATLNPTNHLNLALVQNQQWVNVEGPSGASERLFVARVSRAKGTYTFTARLFLRGIAQYVSQTSDPSLYTVATPPAAKQGDFSGQALLAYKLNWQSVMFVGYGDDRELTDLNQLARLDRQFFVKFSYAFQR
jgi:hypothetical protein